MLALRAWLDDDERNARRLAEHIIRKVLAGHFGFLKLLLDLVEGKLHQTAEEEGTFEGSYVSARCGVGGSSRSGYGPMPSRLRSIRIDAPRCPQRVSGRVLCGAG
jgi:hypothetical protein